MKKQFNIKSKVEMALTEKKNIACRIKPLLVSYREVVTEQDGKYFLDNVNLILDNKIVKKIKFKTKEMPYRYDMGKEIAEKYLIKIITKECSIGKDNVHTQKEGIIPKEEKERKNAADKAALNLMTQLGL